MFDITLSDIRHKSRAAVCAIAMGLFLTGCGTTQPEITPSVVATPPSPETSSAAPVGGVKPDGTTETPSSQISAAVEALELLEVKGRAPKTGYSRDEFGKAWLDINGVGCDTRNQILQRDLTQIIMRDDCVVASGILEDPYSGSIIEFFRDNTPGAPDLDGDGIPGYSNAVQIDHVVSLSDAWQKGAQQLDFSVRAALANDPLNLLAVDGVLNRKKSDGDAATWLPPNKSIRCSYVARQVAVKLKYDLWVTQAEHDAIKNLLIACPGEPLPSGGLEMPVEQASGSDESSSSVNEGITPADDPIFSTCKEAKAAGFGPYQQGVDPEYDFYRDGDSDGLACE